MTVWFNDLLRRLSMSLLPWAARRFEAQFERRIDDYQAEQSRLRSLYGVGPDTPIRGYDEVTRATVQAYADMHPKVRLAYTSGSTTEPKALAYPSQRLRSFKADSRSVGVRAWAKIGIRAPSIFVLSSLADDSSFTSLAVYQRRAPDRITGIIEPARYLFTDPLKRCIEAYGATAARTWLMVLSNPGLIYSTNPSTLAVFLHELNEGWSSSTRMIRDYLSRRGPAAQPALRRVAARIESRGSRARLAEVAAASSPLELGQMFPGLSAYCCWDGGYVRSFLKQITHWLPPPRYTHVPMFAMSTETIETLTWFGPEGEMRFLPLGPGVLYEFLPEGAPDEATQLLLPSQLEPGRAYAMVVSDPYGLVRYQTEDLFQCEGRVRGVPDLRFLRRRGLTWSFTGEKLTAEQLTEAYARLERAVPELASLAAQMTTLPSWPAGTVLPTYHLIVAHSREGGSVVLDPADLARRFDRALMAANREYADKRASGRLAPPSAHVMPYSRLAQALDAARTGGTPGSMRGWESQFKLTPLTRRRMQDVPDLVELC